MIENKLLQGLNSEQSKAVIITDGPLLVLAGAGSGKTKTLIHRLAYLLLVKKIPASQVLAVTFTNKAAQEMRTRVSLLIGQSFKQGGPVVGTFHSVSCRWLRQEANKFGYPMNFSIYDADDQKSLIKTAMRDIGYSIKNVQPGAILNAISRAKADLLTPSEYGAEVADDFFTETVAKVYSRYQELLRENRAFDFDDLIGQMVRLWQDLPEVLLKYQNMFKYILVDEYQDVNRAQYLWTKLLAEKNKNLCVVGDDWQSIYGWRGADFGNILRFTEDYPGTKVIKLEQNYRSTKIIVNAGNIIMSKVERKADKTLWTSNVEGELIRVVQVEDEVAESRWVVEDVISLCESRSQNRESRGKIHDSRFTIHDSEVITIAEYDDVVAEEESKRFHTGLLPDFMKIKRFEGDRTELKKFVVLYRTNAQSRAMEEACLRTGLPYQLVGAIRFYERREVKDMLAYLRLIVNPMDGISFERAILSSPRGVGLSTVEQLLTKAQEQKISALEVAEIEGVKLPPARQQALMLFVNLIQRLDKILSTLTVSEVIDQAAAGGGLVEHLTDGTSAGEMRLQNIAELKTVAQERSPGKGRDALEKFLTDVSLWQDQDSFDASRGAVTLMTVHAAKGLEFDTVYVIGMEEGLFPHMSSMDDPKELEEERRLAYVAMTRARTNLACLYTQNRRLFGKVTPGIPSRFLGELPEEYVKAVNVNYF